MPPEKPLISVVIPAYNRRQSILDLLADVYRQSGVAFEVIVVDDCSPDDTVAAVAARYPQVRLFQNAVNGGPAVTRNRGIREARGELIVGFDSDVTVPDPTVLQRVAETFRSYPQITGLAFRLLAPDGKAEDALRWWHPVPIGRYASERFETSYFSGTGYAFRREPVLTAGLFPEILYMHYEEVELAYRILDQGGSIMHCPDLPVLHHANPIAQRSKIKIFYKPRNQVLLALSCYTWPRALTYLVPRFLYNGGMAVLHGHPGEFFRAMVSAWQLAPRILSTRAPLRAETWRRIDHMQIATPGVTPAE